ncbi:serine O-acetyltransferase EpsC [Natrinema caseinilyticum]|uniref:serine O-acetyltransferase EpsC n=1 Tax=Natrinema caseinilyticum TaxID=2961570 RepID=UPI0020C5A1B3|nr:serine O-acetyltransferase EpsC [Natrinema caseinilyticum]
MTDTHTEPVQDALLGSYDDDDISVPQQSGRDRDRSTVREEVSLLRKLLFPQCWCVEPYATRSAVSEKLDRLGDLFVSGIELYSKPNARAIVDEVLQRLPDVRAQLTDDVEAAYKGDPAAKSELEIIRCYPGFLAVTVHRVAHLLYRHGAPEYARELAEAAKTTTGIDIHPGATIGSHFFVDHGTGVVIGETATIGDWVRLYQDVTLGTLHFKDRKESPHMLEKGYERHPTIGDHVVIGAGANVMGPISIGDHAKIGSNSWVTDDVPEHTTVYVSNQVEMKRREESPVRGE